MSIEFKHLETSLSRNGYAIPKDQLTPKELEKLKSNLMASPVIQGGYVPPGTATFPIYLESPKKIHSHIVSLKGF